MKRRNERYNAPAGSWQLFGEVGCAHGVEKHNKCRKCEQEMNKSVNYVRELPVPGLQNTDWANLPCDVSGYERVSTGEYLALIQTAMEQGRFALAKHYLDKASHTTLMRMELTVAKRAKHA